MVEVILIHISQVFVVVILLSWRSVSVWFLPSEYLVGRESLGIRKISPYQLLSCFSVNCNLFNVCFWRRYEYDTFVICCWQNKLNTFLNQLNSKHPKIKFTMEMEDNRYFSWAYKKEDNSLGYTIYRKKSHTNPERQITPQLFPTTNVIKILVTRSHSQKYEIYILNSALLVNIRIAIQNKYLDKIKPKQRDQKEGITQRKPSTVRKTIHWQDKKKTGNTKRSTKRGSSWKTKVSTKSPAKTATNLTSVKLIGKIIVRERSLSKRSTKENEHHL